MKKVLLLFLAAILLLTTTSDLFAGKKKAEERMSFSLQIRSRGEMNGKDFNSDTDLNSYDLLRTRLGITFRPMKDMEAFVQVQDSRVFGEESSTLTDGSANNFDLHQAYFKVNNLFKMPLTLKVGRMEVVYGPQRLIGSVGWHNIGRSFDGAVLTLNLKKVAIDFFNFKEIENLEVGDTGDKDVIGIHADFKLSPKYKTQAFIIWQKMEPTEELSRYTAGFYVAGKMGKFS
ncbi:MAG: alginate export family protein, partial [bacterium]|nr:alginate export family protein [bacterium]